VSLPTPAVLVPQTAVGKFYLALPDAIARIAAAYAQRLGFPAQNFAAEMMAQASGLTYEILREYVEANGMKAALEFLQKTLPLQLIGDRHFDLKLGRRWSFVGDQAINPVSDERMDFATYLVTASTAEAIEHRSTITATVMEGGQTYPTAQLAQLAQQVAARLDRENLRGDAWGQSAGAFADDQLRKVFPAGLPSPVWRNLFFIAKILWDDGVRQIDDAQSIYGLGSIEIVSEYDGELQTTIDYERIKSWHNIHTDYSGQGGTNYFVKLAADGSVLVASTGFSTSDLGRILTAVAFAFAATGVGAAIASLSAEGLTLANAAQLVSGVGGLPDVDLGVAEQIAGSISSSLALAARLPGADVIPDIDFDAGSFADIIDVGGLDLPSNFVVDAGDLAEGFAGNLDDLVAALEPLQIDLTDLAVDLQGNVFDVTGSWVALTEEDWVAAITVDEMGNVVGPDGVEIVGAAEAETVYGAGGDDAIAVRVSERLDERSGTANFSQVNSNHPAGAPPPARTVAVPTFTSELVGLVKAYFSYDIARQQLQRTGRYTPGYVTNPGGSPRPPLVGVPIQRPDGSVVTNNGNGTTTVIRPDGRVETVPTQVTPGTFRGQGGALIPGIDNTTLLIGGAALLAVVLLSRRS
jgi:hypothetical protein